MEFYLLNLVKIYKTLNLTHLINPDVEERFYSCLCRISMEYFIFLFVLLQPYIVDTFLLNSTQARLTSFEFQHLSQLVINEEQSRHHVENEVSSLERRVAEIETDLKTKYKAEMAAFKTEVEIQINTSKGECENKVKLIKTSLEEEANLTKTAFEREVNTTKLTLEQQSRELEKEKYNSRQLEREYTRLMMDFRNLSLQYDMLVSKDIDLNSDIEKINKSYNFLQMNASRMNVVVTKNSVSIASNKANISTLYISTTSLDTKAGELKRS